MATLIRDLAYAVRTLRHNPGFALTAIITVALGLGTTTAIFSVVNAVLLKPLPYTDEQRLVLLWNDLRNRNVTDFPFSLGDFPDLVEQGTLFESIGGVITFRRPITGGDGDPEVIAAANTTTNVFHVLQVPMALGRGFVEEDGIPQPPGAQQDTTLRLPAVAVLSYGIWRRRWGGDSTIIGRGINLMSPGAGNTIVAGVLPPGFELLFPPGTGVEKEPQIYTAMRADFRSASRINHPLRVVARLKPGVTYDQAQVQIDRIAASLREQIPIKQTAGMHYRLEPMRADLLADVRPAIRALMGAVIFVLLIACANVANLLLVRSSQRERELAVRAALGGSRNRLIGQMLAESLVLAGGGAALGLVLAAAGIELLLAIAPADLPRIETVAIEPTVVAFAGAAALASAALFGVIPALRASRTDVASTLRAGGRSAGLGTGRMMRHGVVAAEVALSFVLLIGSGLMLRSFVTLYRADPGYDPSSVLTFNISNLQIPEAQARRAFSRELRDRLGGLPGVQAVAATNALPFSGAGGNGRYGTEAALTDETQYRQAEFRFVIPGYFETLRTRVLQGRILEDRDNDSASNVIVIDRVLAARTFPNQSALGQRLLVRLGGEAPDWYTVIGVVEHQRIETLAADGRETIFFPDGEVGFGAGQWMLRTAGDPTSLTSQVRGELRQMNPRAVLNQVQPLSALVDRARAPTRFALVLIAVFAGVAAALSAIGLYGVLATAVRQRTPELGVRMAFGAPRESIFQLVIGQGLRLSGAGMGVGLLAAFALTRTMRSMLVGVEPTDPVTFVAIGVVFLLIAALACWLPARRAAGLDPSATLREG